MKPRWPERARDLAKEVYALALACKHPKAPWYAKALAACVVAYAFSPIDLIPDPIPVIGHLDDVLLVPLGVLAVRRMVSAEVLEECRERARRETGGVRRVSRAAAVAVVAVWVAGAAGLVTWLWRAFLVG